MLLLNSAIQKILKKICIFQLRVFLHNSFREPLCRSTFSVQGSIPWWLQPPSVRQELLIKLPQAARLHGYLKRPEGISKSKRFAQAPPLCVLFGVLSLFTASPGTQFSQARNLGDGHSTSHPPGLLCPVSRRASSFHCQHLGEVAPLPYLRYLLLGQVTQMTLTTPDRRLSSTLATAPSPFFT